MMKVPPLLNDLYNLREKEELLERGEIGKYRTTKMLLSRKYTD